MATEVQFTVCWEHCKDFRVTDQTGTYDAVENPGGWNPAGGPAVSSVYESKMYITFPDGHQVVVDLLDGALPWPNDTYKTKTIANTDIGLGLADKLPSGKYIFKRVDKAILEDGTQWVGTKSWGYWVHCIEDCCLDKMGAKMAREKQAPLNCNNPDSATKKWMDAWLELKGSDYLFGCNDYAGAQRSLEQVQELCAGCDCGC